MHTSLERLVLLARSFRSRRRMRWAVGLGAGLGLAPAPSCGGELNAAHCSFLSGDATCAALHSDGSRPFCSAGCSGGPPPDPYGCVRERPADACYSPCGQGTTLADRDACLDEATATGPEPTGDASSGVGSSTGTGTGPTTLADDTSTSGAGCLDHADCAEPAPLCLHGACVPCHLAPEPAAACVALDPARPLCTDAGCVACTEGDATACQGSTPVCDVATGACVGCSFHAQCPASACHIEDGSCLPGDRVWHVDGDAPSCAVADGSPAAPFCTLAAALALVPAGETGTLWVHARDGDAAYAGGVTITANRVVAIRGLADERPRFAGGGIGAPITVTAGAVAYLDRGRVDGSAVTAAVQVVGAVLHLDGWLVVLNQGGGVSLSNGAVLHARNSVLGANGSALVDAQALRAASSSFDLRYVTMAGNDSVGLASIACTGGSAGTIANSIVVALDPASIACRGLVVKHSAIDSFLDGEGVVLHDAFDAGWFVAPGAGDFHLAPGHPFDGVAQWQPGDPLVDLDGDPRPMRPGAPDVAGADR
jgi:hypothetical protein